MSGAPQLPPPSQEIERLVKVIGEQAALRLIENLGGQKIYVPHQVQKNQITAAIGRDAAALLSGWRGGEYIKIPVGREWLVRVYRTQGLSYNKIAARLHCCQDTVHRILQDNALTHRQLDLFDP